MKNLGIIFVIVLLLAVIAFVIYKSRETKKEAVKKTTVASTETNAQAFDAVANALGVYSMETVRFGQRNG